MKLFSTFSTVVCTSLDAINNVFLTAKVGSAILMEESVKARIETSLDSELNWNNSEDIDKAMEAVNKLSDQLRAFAAK